MPALRTVQASRSSQVSAMTRRFRRFRLPASKPESGAFSEVFTLWLSIAPALGCALRPAARRACATSTRLISATGPLSRER
jgi:hypothetical protein